MKKILLIALLTLVIVPATQAVSALPHLSSLRAETFNQLTIASNNVAATNDVKVNQKLIKTLLSTLKLIDKTKPTYATGAKALGTVAKNINRTSVSNVFAPIFDSTLDTYVNSLMNEGDILSGRLANFYPSKARTSASASLQQVTDALAAAENNPNFLLAVKSLSLAVKNFSKAQKSTDKAEAVPAPPTSVIATVSGDSHFSYNSTLGAAIAVNSGNGLINSGQAVLKSPYGTRSVLISLSGVNSGPNTLSLGNHSVGSAVTVIEVYGDGTGSAYESTSGTLNVTFNPATKSLFGTFTATCVDGVKTITITGSFTANTL